MSDNKLRDQVHRFGFAIYFLRALAIQFEEDSYPRPLDIQKAHQAFSYFIFHLSSFEIENASYVFDKETCRYVQLNGAIEIARVFGIFEQHPSQNSKLYMVKDARTRCESLLIKMGCLSIVEQNRAKMCAEWAAYTYYLNVPLLAAVHATELL